MANELPIPPAALTDDGSRELIRIWAARGSQHISLATGLWSDPAAWGMALVDLARLLSQAYEQSGMLTADEALYRIRAGFDAEWSNPTDNVVGRLDDT